MWDLQGSTYCSISLVFEAPQLINGIFENFWKSLRNALRTGNSDKSGGELGSPNKILGFRNSWKSQTLFWVVKCPLDYVVQSCDFAARTDTGFKSGSNPTIKVS